MANLSVSTVLSSSGIAPVTPMGYAALFGLLAATTLTTTGTSTTTRYKGAGTSITGTITGAPATHTADGHVSLAIQDAKACSANQRTLAVTTDLTGTDLEDASLTPGVFSFTGNAPGSVISTKTLTLTGAGDYIFNIGGNLTLGAAFTITLAGGATAERVYFNVNGLVTTGANAVTKGNIIAVGSITTGAGTAHVGRLISTGGLLAISTTANTGTALTTVVSSATVEDLLFLRVDVANSHASTDQTVSFMDVRIVALGDNLLDNDCAAVVNTTRMVPKTATHAATVTDSCPILFHTPGTYAVICEIVSATESIRAASAVITIS